jgi:hypothetical protein
LSEKDMQLCGISPHIMLLPPVFELRYSCGAVMSVELIKRTIFADAAIVHGGAWAARLEQNAGSANEFSTMTMAVPIDFTDPALSALTRHRARTLDSAISRETRWNCTSQVCVRSPIRDEAPGPMSQSEDQVEDDGAEAIHTKRAQGIDAGPSLPDALHVWIFQNLGVAGDYRRSERDGCRNNDSVSRVFMKWFPQPHGPDGNGIIDRYKIEKRK